MLKSIIAWIISLGIAVVALYIGLHIIGFAVGMALKLVLLVPLIIIAIPIYLVVRKQLIK